MSGAHFPVFGHRIAAFKEHKNACKHSDSSINTHTHTHSLRVRRKIFIKLQDLWYTTLSFWIWMKDWGWNYNLLCVCFLSSFSLENTVCFHPPPFCPFAVLVNMQVHYDFVNFFNSYETKALEEASSFQRFKNRLKSMYSLIWWSFIRRYGWRFCEESAAWVLCNCRK